MKLTKPNQRLQIYLGAAKSTNDMNIVLTFDIINSISNERISKTTTFLKTNGVDPVILLGPPLINQIWEIVECYIYNIDTATKDVYIEIVDNSSVIIKKETALAVGGTLTYTPNRGWE